LSLVLVIDTSLSACCAGLFRDGESLIEAVDPMDRGHAERIGPMISELFRETGVNPRELTDIGVTLGPGSFTGVRIGLAFAKGMACGLGLRLKGAGTLEALNAHPGLAEREPLAVIHGGRGNLYIQHGGRTPRTIPFAELDVLARTHAVDLLTGPAVNEVKDRFRDVEVLDQAWPSLKALAGCILEPGHDGVTPMYMREADAVASTRGIITLGAAP